MNSGTGVCLGLLLWNGRRCGPATGPIGQRRPTDRTMELDARWTALAGSKGGRCVGALMSSGSIKEFEEFARDCVRLAEQADTPELREKLLNLAREWMRAVMT